MLVIRLGLSSTNQELNPYRDPSSFSQTRLSWLAYLKLVKNYQLLHASSHNIGSCVNEYARPCVDLEEEASQSW